MIFEFRAHHPSAYWRFAFMLLLLIAANLFFVTLFFPHLKTMNDAATKSIVLVIPWLVLLLLPSALCGLMVYRSFVKTYRFTLSENYFTTEIIKRGQPIFKNAVEWKDLKNVRMVDFEDNHYCTLEFTISKHNVVIHRESGEFEKFYEEVMKSME